MGRGRCRLGFLPSEGQPEGPGYRSSSWSVKRRVYVCEYEGVCVCVCVCVCVWGGGDGGRGASLAKAATELSTTPRPREHGGASQMG